MKKAIVNLFLVVMVLAALVALCVGVSAAESYEPVLPLLAEGYVMQENADGTANEDGSENDFYWELDSEGTLIISHKTPEGVENPSTQIVTNPTIAGTSSYKNLPWNGYQTDIKKIVFDVNDPVIYIECNYLFMSLTNLTKVVLPAGQVNTYAQYLFTGCEKLVTFGPEGTPNNTFDLRNMVGVKSDGKSIANSRIFPGCAVGANITVLMPYAKTLSLSTLPCIGYTYNYKNGTKIYPNFEGAASVTFKVFPGTVGETVANAFIATYNSETNPWKTADYSDTELPLLDETACGYVYEGTNDFYWQINMAGTLIISHKPTEGVTASNQLQITATLTDNGSSKAPWYSNRSKITKIVFDVEDSVIKLVQYATFSNLTNLTTVVIPENCKVELRHTYMFSGCSSLSKFGPEGTDDDTFDFRKVVCVSTNGNSFKGCAVDGKNITVLMPAEKTLGSNTYPCIGYSYEGVLKVPGSNYAVFDNAASVEFKVIPGSVSEEVAQAYVDSKNSETTPWTVVNYVEGEYVLKGTGSSGHSGEGWTCNWEYAIDLATGVLDIKFVSSTSSEYCSYVANSVIKDVASKFGYLITRVNFIDFRQLYDGWYGSIIPSTMTKLETVDIGSVEEIRAGANTVITFAAPELTTFGSSVRGTLNEGVLDLSGVTFVDVSQSSYKLFSGCSGVTKVIVPDGDMPITATTFADCANVEKITLGKLSVADGAFDHMTALNTIVVTDKAFSDNTANKLLPVDKDGLTIICYSKTAADSLTDYGATKVIYFGDVIIPDGFSVRTNKIGETTNGLRTFYKFDTARRTALEQAGFTFKEFGGILVSTTKLGDNTLSLSWNGTEYVPNIASAVKAPVFIGEEQVGKILADGDGNSATIEFAITLVNFVDNYTTDIYACGYAIFVDGEGNEYIEYANYGDLDGKEDWKYVNIFELAMFLYTERYDSVKNIVADEAPVWGILGTGAVTLENSAREITLDDGNTSMMIVEDADGAYTLFVRCLDGTMPELAAAQAKAEALGYTLTNSIGIMVKEDTGFFVKTATEHYVDKKLEAAKLTKTEKARSFIFVTDNHWGVNTKNDSNVTFATGVMKYASDQLGGAPVIFGGDPFPGYNAAFDENDPYANINTALGVIDDYIKDQIMANFGTNFFYALGNHDTNIIGYQNAKKSVANGGLGLSAADAMQYYLISDKDMYDHSVGLFADKGIVFDTDGIEAIKKVLTDNADIVNAFLETHTYTTYEEIVSEAEYLMKMHYHYDDTDAKTRYIVLDTGGCGRIQMGLYKFGWNGMFAAQYKWLANTLKGTPAGYNVVVVGHQIVESKTTVTNANRTEFQAGMAEIYDLISAFKTGANVTVKYPANSWHATEYGQIFMDMVEYGTATIDFEKPFDGTVFTIGGHVHSDNAWYSNNVNGELTYVQFGDEGAEVVDGAVLAITTGTARNHDTHPDVDGYDMSSKFPNNIRFDIVTIKDDGSVQLTRIGAGYDRTYTYAK